MKSALNGEEMPETINMWNGIPIMSKEDALKLAQSRDNLHIHIAKVEG